MSKTKNPLLKAILVLEVLCEYCEADNLKSTSPEVVFKNPELHKFESQVYRLIHAARTSMNKEGCKHPEWEKELEDLYTKFTDNRLI